MKVQEARSLVVQALKMGGWNQVNGIVEAVGQLKGQMEGKKDQYATSGRQYLQRGDESVIMEVLWGLIIQGVLVPGINDQNPNLPHLRLTEYGKNCLAAERFLPHDPDGFLVQFQREVPTADPVIVDYLTESLQCFLRGLDRAAAVMLGGASEMAILVLCESFGNAILDTRRKAKYFTELNRTTSIFQRFKVFDRYFAGVKADLPKPLQENIDSLLAGVFDLIRNSRNDAGHPASGVVVDRDIVYSHLRLFVPYCKRIYGLAEWFSNNPIR